MRNIFFLITIFSILLMGDETTIHKSVCIYNLLVYENKLLKSDFIKNDKNENDLNLNDETADKLVRPKIDKLFKNNDFILDSILKIKNEQNNNWFYLIIYMGKRFDPVVNPFFKGRHYFDTRIFVRNRN